MHRVAGLVYLFMRELASAVWVALGDRRAILDDYAVRPEFVV